MKRLFLWISLVLMGVLLFSQEVDLRAELKIQGGVDRYAITPNGTIHVATKAGFLYYSKGNFDEWHFGSISSTIGDFDGEHFEQIDFFNDKIGIITGYLHDEEDNDYLYRTTDGGSTWQKVPIKYGKWIDASYVNKKGEAWLASADQVMYYSNDFGENWSLIDRPESKTNQRVTELSFNHQGYGVAGTGWNRIYFSENNGQNWSAINTPLDQGLYEKRINHRPKIEDILISETEIFVKQNKTVFHTEIGKIKWQKIEGAYGFEYDKEKREIYVFFTDKVIKYSSSSIDKIKLEIPLDEKIISSHAKNGKLYSLHWDHISIISQNGIKKKSFFTLEYSIEEDPATRISSQNIWANGAISLYQKNHRLKRYQRIKTSNISIDNLYPLSKSKVLLATSNYQQHYLYNSELKDFSIIDVRDYINPPKINEIKKIKFIEGSFSCFHSSEKMVEYEIDNGKINLSELKLEDGKVSKRKFKDNILFNAEDVDKLRKILLLLHNESISNVLSSQEIGSNFAETNCLLEDSISLSELNSPRYSPSTNWMQKEIRIVYGNNKEIVISSRNRSSSIADLSWIANTDGFQYNVGGLAVWDIFNKGLNPLEYTERKQELVQFLQDFYCN